MSYLDSIDSITGTRRVIARFGSMPVTLSNKSSIGEFVQGVTDKQPADVPDGLGTLAGAAAGAIWWKNHRVLGALGGASLGRNVPALFRPQYRRDAMCNMGVTGTAVFGSLLLPDHPAIGYIAGALVGGAAIYFGKLRK